MKKILFLMMFVGFFFVAASDVSAQNCKPGPNQIAIFADWKFQGNCVVVDAGELYNVEDVGFANDGLSSVMLGKNVGAQLCRDINLEGVCQSFSRSIRDLTGTRVGNDTVSSIKIFFIK